MISKVSIRNRLCLLVLICQSTIAFSLKPENTPLNNQSEAWWNDYLSDAPVKGRKILNVVKYNAWLKDFMTAHQDIFHSTLIGTEDQTEIFRLDSTAPADIKKPQSESRKIRVFLGSGVHGKEEMGPLIVRHILEELVQHKELLRDVQFTVIPLINPYGQTHRIRGTSQSPDLNRSFGDKAWVNASRIVADSLKHERFDLAIDLHGKRTSNGFFFIRGKDDHGIATKALQSVSPDIIMQSRSGTYPGYRGSSDGKDPKRYLLSSQGVATSQNPNTFKSFLGTLGEPFTYTMEYPGLQSAEVQIYKACLLFFEMIRALQSHLSDSDQKKPA